jgi:tetratricopeptide (TPR) repeat protein
MNELHDLVKRAEALALGGKWDEEAIGVNTRILELDDRVPGAYTRLARCFKVQGNWLAARSMYRQVLAFDSSNRIASNQLAIVEERLRDLADLELVAEIDDYHEALAIGVAMRRQGDAQLAIAALGRAVELDPTVYALTALGAAYRSNGQLADAEAAYGRAIEMEDHAAARVGLAAVYADQGRLTEAHKLYWHVLRADNRNIYALNGLGAVLLRRGRLEQAEGCFVRSAEVGQASDESITRLADLRAEYARCGDSAGEQRIQALLGRLKLAGRSARS